MCFLSEKSPVRWLGAELHRSEKITSLQVIFTRLNIEPILKADPGGIFEYRVKQIIFEAVLVSLDIDPTHCRYSIPCKAVSFPAAEMTPTALYKGELAVYLQDRWCKAPLYLGWTTIFYSKPIYSILHHTLLNGDNFPLESHHWSNLTYLTFNSFQALIRSDCMEMRHAWTILWICKYPSTTVYQKQTADESIKGSEYYKVKLCTLST